MIEFRFWTSENETGIVWLDVDRIESMVANDKNTLVVMHSGGSWRLVGNVESIFKKMKSPG